MFGGEGLLLCVHPRVVKVGDIRLGKERGRRARLRGQHGKLLDATFTIFSPPTPLQSGAKLVSFSSSPSPALLPISDHLN